MNLLEEGTTLTLDFGKLAKVAARCPDVIPVAVQHADTHELILVAYTNEKAMRQTFATRTLVLWSTSRNELWEKVKDIRVAMLTSIGLIAVAMLLAGGLTALQTLIIVAALPFALLMVAVMIGLYRVLHAEARREGAEERRARRAIEAWIAREQEQRAGESTGDE